MESNSVLVGSEIHGFRTTEDLDVGNMMEEAKTRWLRPNEIHAVLFNHKQFTVHVKPVNLPKSGTIVLFDRKMLRNFRKDGYNWKKKKDGKTVKEAHEHLKVGNVERIHVYYAHGEDNPTFVRRCYWLLDKSLEHIVLVHYRETQEGSPAPATPGNSNSSSAVYEPPATWPQLEEPDSAVNYRSIRPTLEHHGSMTVKDHERRLHEINTLDWDELLVSDGSNNQYIPPGGKSVGTEPMNQYSMPGYQNENSATNKVSPESSVDSFSGHVVVSGPGPLAGGDCFDDLLKDTLQSQDSFGKWVNYMIADSPGSVDQALESSISTGHNRSFMSPMVDNHQSSGQNQIFNIVDVSPSWALSTEDTKILVVGYFKGGHLPSTNSALYLVCGDTIIPVEILKDGVFRCVIPPQSPGMVNLHLSFDGQTPISQVLSFEFRATVAPTGLDDKCNWEEFQLQMRLAHLLFSSSQSLSAFSSKISQSTLKEAKAFAQRTSHFSKGWLYLSKLIGDAKIPFSQAKEGLFELTIQNRLKEWLLEKVVLGCKLPERDEQGQSVIHLCAILGYAWAILPYSWSGLSMDYRDKFGWTALHWAAYYGSEKMVAALLSAGAKPNLVTDPTSENRDGCTAAELASKNGFDGLAAYLAENALVAQLKDMTLAGNVSGTLQVTPNEPVNIGNFSEEELYLKDTLAAYRTAADAAARIQAAFREHSFKIRTKEVEASNPEAEARSIVAAMKIQHAFRNFETHKKLAAVARIQYRFRTWKMRREFLNMRRQAMKIQAAFRGFQARRHYTKIVWSVGIVEKAILRWRLKRRGFRGLQIQSHEPEKDPNEEEVTEEAFFRASRKQAEERVERSVVKVQTMFRSKKAQEDYRRMKLEHSKATLEYEELTHPDADMG